MCNNGAMTKNGILCIKKKKQCPFQRYCDADHSWHNMDGYDKKCKILIGDSDNSKE